VGLAAAEEASTVFGEGLASALQVRRVYVKGSQEAALTLPDGDSRLVIENRVGRSAVRMGGHYNFITGKIEAWVNYALPLWRTGPLLQIAASDRVGLGQVYYRARSLERARELPVGLGHQFGFGSLLATASRTSWRYAPLDAPASAEVGLIDAIGMQFTTTDIIPDLAERLDFLKQDETAVEFKHAFRGLGGDWAFDRVTADIRDWLPGLRAKDEVMARVYGGQAYNIATTLPIRETFGLGGANALKGYQYEEFRGNGILLFGTEYALVSPWTFAITRIRLDVQQTAVLLFAEEGRIQSAWTRGDPFKWSAGAGLRFKGRLLDSHPTIIRLYVAQSGEYPERHPVFYALANVGER
jgi:hypothetical protein